MSDKTIEFLVKKDDELQRLDLFLKSKMSPISRSSIKKFIDQGLVNLNGIQEYSSSKKLKNKDKVQVQILTKSELKTLLEKRYSEFLIDPEIKIRIAGFKSIRVLARGELRNPGFYKFPAYESGSFVDLDKSDNSRLDSFIENNNELDEKYNLQKYLNKFRSS